MKKKVVALLTLAMFVMTLLPVAAFAAPADQATPENSYVEFEYEDPTVDVNEVVTVTAYTYADEEQQKPQPLKDVRVYLKDANGNVVKNATIGKFDEDGSIIPAEQSETGKNNGIFKFDQLTEKEKFGISVASAGVYTLYVGQPQKNATDGTNIAEVEYKKGRTITVNPLDEDHMTFKYVNNQDHDVTMDVKDDVAALEKDVLEDADFEFNGRDTFTVTGRLLGKDGADNSNKPIKDAEVTLSSNKDNLKLKEETVTTDRNGEFDIEFSLDAEVNATITVAYGDLKYTIRVNAGSNELDTINTTKDGGYVLAGKDDKWSEKDSVLFSDAVQFELLDENGKVVEGDKLTGEPAAVKGGKHDKYVTIKKPGNSTLEEDDLVLAWDEEEECYTLKYTGVKADAKKDLVEGEYTVTVALKSGNSATATFNVAKFGDVKDLVVKTYYKKGNNKKVATDKEIALGDKLIVKVNYVDKNGLEIPADKKNLRVGADGKAIKNELADYKYQLKDNKVANESLIGTTIKVTAFDYEKYKTVVKELTVVDAYKTYSLSFDNKEGKVNVDNNVKVSIVDENGNVAENVKGSIYAYVDSQSNKDAKVTIDKQKLEDEVIKKGKFNITVYANQATTADIVVGVKADNGAIYAGTLTYTFGEESIPAGTSVVMTLGSTEMIVNNQLVDMKDAAPFAQDNRTFVPFRALGEALGAKVDYDQDAKTVTYKLGSSEIVMTLGSKDYTVNGVKKTMDVAPFAKDNRTYVPVRFVGEGLGFTVTGLTNANGQYVAVAFTK